MSQFNKVKKLDPEELIKYLITHNPVTQSDIAREFDVNPMTAKYWLEKLVEKGVLEEKIPKKNVASKHGAEYRLCRRVTPFKHLLIPITLLVSTILFTIPFLTHPKPDVIPLIILSYIGTFFSFTWYINVVKDRIRRIVKNL